MCWCLHARELVRVGPEITASTPRLFELLTNNDTCNASIENVDFSHTDADYESCFAGSCEMQSVSWLNSATVHFEFSSNISLTNCTIQHTGGHGLWFGAGVRNAQFVHGRVRDVGAGAVRIGEPRALPAHPDPALRVARNVRVSDSVLHDGGNIYRAGTGVLLQVAEGVTIEHNEISMFRYTGVSIGWTWQYGPTNDGNNTVSYCNISMIGMGELSDLGCIYHLGQDHGTTIHANLCSNVSSYDGGAMGIYLDQASRFVSVTDNLVHDVKCAGFLQNFGLNCTITNNVFSL